MSTDRKDIQITLPQTKRLIVHIVEAMDESASYDIYYLPDPGKTSCATTRMAPIIRGGVTLRLNPQNTPLILELAGTYSFVKTTPATSQINYILEDFPLAGDITALQQG